jgi:hypothetical protein
MLRRSLLIFAFAGLTVGCQTTRPTAPVAERPSSSSSSCACSSAPVAVVPAREEQAVVASALVFDPPVAADQPPLELSRAEREPRVSVGYDGPIIENYWVRTDDRQMTSTGFTGVHGSGSGGPNSGRIYDQFERRAVTERIGVRYR